MLAGVSMNKLIIFLGEYFYIFILIISGLRIFFLDQDIRKQLLRLAFFATPLAFIVSRILNNFIINPRPFVEHGTTPLFPHTPDNGFPSDHALLVMLVAFLISPYDKRFGVVLCVLGIIVGIARVAAGVHHMTDIAGSIMVTGLSVLCVYQILKRKK